MDITVGPTTTQQEICGHFAGPGYSGQEIAISCNGKLLGRYMKLVLTKPDATSWLSITEVSVFAYV